MTTDNENMNIAATMATSMMVGYAIDPDGNRAIGLVFETIAGTAIFVLDADASDELSTGLAVLASSLRGGTAAKMQ